MILHTKHIFERNSALQNMQTCHQGVPISQLRLNSNTHTRVLDFTGSNFKPRFEAMTANMFPQYETMVDDYGGIITIPLCKIPDSVYMDPHDDKFWGKITLRHPDHIGQPADPDETCTYEVRAIMLYKDLKFIKNEFSSRKMLELLR